jgi:hypothetical protein
MKKVLFTLLVVAMVSCNNSTETTVTDTTKCDSTKCDSVCADSTKVLVDTTATK